VSFGQYAGWGEEMEGGEKEGWEEESERGSIKEED